MVQVQRKHGPGYKKKVRFEMDCCRVSFGYFLGGGSRGLGVGGVFVGALRFFGGFWHFLNLVFNIEEYLSNDKKKKFLLLKERWQHNQGPSGYLL